MKSNHPLLIISYFCGIKGNCPAEWVDDKIRAFEKAGRQLVVLTGLGSHVIDRSGVLYIRVPSLSWNDFKIEIGELRSGFEKVPLQVCLFSPVAFLIGHPVDFILRKITKGVTGGRWSWVITAIPVALFIKLRHAAGDILATGGPTSAHIVGGVLASLFKANLYCEFQDPILGANMTRSRWTRIISLKIESWLIRVSKKSVFVTQAAGLAAQKRNQQFRDKIASIYPGSWNFFEAFRAKKSRKHECIEFLHLGTLYGSRNLDLFFKALDDLRVEGFALANIVHVVNLGAVYCDSRKAYQARPDFELLDALDRVQALERAQLADCLLLIQHNDECSLETIPYKTYDYLNLEMPILGLLKNNELAELIDSSGSLSASVDDLGSIKETLKSCLLRLAESGLDSQNQSIKIDISTQSLKIFE